MINVTELRPGNYFSEQGQIFSVINISLNKTAMRKMIAKIKVKNLRTGAITELSRNSGYMIDLIYLEKKKMMYLYSSEDSLIFMDNTTYEQIEISKNKLKWEINFLIPNTETQILAYKNEILGISLPAKIALKVIDCEPSTKIKTDTVKNVSKEAILETNYKLKIPSFINKDEVIYVRTDTGEYDGRSNN